MQPFLTLGPVLLNWPAEHWRDFYFQVADEMPVETVFIGEVVCSKRAPLFDRHFEEVVSRLKAAGKRVVFSTLAEVTSKIDRRLVKRVAASDELYIEANDASALWHLGGRPHAVGPYLNVYNEESLEFLCANGARSVCLPPELPANAIAAMANTAAGLGCELEVQVYGRIPLALSARCYHARAHNKTKDSCLFVCDQDPDGMVLCTQEGRPFLTINGVQTQSYSCLNLVGQLQELIAAGISRFRISPQSIGTGSTAECFQAVLQKKMSAEEATAKLAETEFEAPFSNGFYHQKPGHRWCS
ncbi:MAG: U32 family peptidase [Alphaproteobacteria bacterium]|nr:U32 family peptidase [Alphaproteobacteria bacterium]